MKENEIPTAEQFLNNYWFKAGIHIGNRDYATMEEYAIDFAKLHVKQALESAAEKAELVKYTDNFGDPAIYLNKKSILSAYPEELIK